MKITVYKYYKNVGSIELSEAISRIKNGFYKREVEQTRQHLKKRDLESYNKSKKSIPAFVTAGLVKGSHTDSNLKDYSGYLILDFDKLSGNELDSAFQKACNISFTYACFRSPSEEGIKIIVKHDADKESHKIAFNQAADYYEEKLKINIDRSGSNLSRLCFFSFDPSLYINNNCETFKVEINKTNVELINQLTLNTDIDELKYELKFQQAFTKTRTIMVFSEGNRNNFIYTLALNCSSLEIPLESAIKVINRNFGYDKDEVENTISSAYKRVNLINGEINQENSLFSFNFKNYFNYKDNVTCDTRILFEYFLNKFLFFNREFYWKAEIIETETGIGRRRRERITKEFVVMKFLIKRTDNYNNVGHPGKYTYYNIIPKELYKAARILMKDSSEFEKKIRPLLARGNSRLGYGGWKKF